jgi:hypothetical protein
MTLKQLIQTITKKEWQFVIFLIIIVIVLTTGPYLYGFLNAPEGHFYNWTHSITRGDPYVYFSYIQQVKEGNLLLINNFTSELPQTGTLNLFWLKVGLVAKLFNLSAPVAFHVFRFILTPIFFLVAYVFLAYIFKNKFKRKLSLIFLAFSSGIGAYLAQYYNKLYPADLIDIIYQWPIDLWVSETNVFLTLTQTPHFIISWILLIAFSLFMLLAFANNKYFYSLIAGLIGFYWFNFHPYYFPYIFVILAIYIVCLFLKTKKIHYLWHYLLSMFLSLPFVIYHYFLIKTDWLIGVRASQNICLTPPVEFVVVGFGFLLVFGLVGLIYLLANKKLFKNDKLLFLGIWLIAGLILIYAPLAWQRRLLMGLQLPLVIFTVIALSAIYNYVNKKFVWFKNVFDYFQYLVIILLISMFCFSTIFNLTRDVFYYYNHNYSFYLPDEYQDATKWLKDNNIDNAVILSSEFNGYTITGMINQRVYLGHGHETVFFEAKKSKVADFFQDNLTDEKAIKFLQDNGISYIFYTFFEKNIGDFDPDQKTYLLNVYDGQRISIYKLNKN